MHSLSFMKSRSKNTLEFTRRYEGLRALLLPQCFHRDYGVIIARIKNPVTI